MAIIAGGSHARQLEDLPIVCETAQEFIELFAKLKRFEKMIW